MRRKPARSAGPGRSRWAPPGMRARPANPTARVAGVTWRLLRTARLRPCGAMKNVTQSCCQPALARARSRVDRIGGARMSDATLQPGTAGLNTALPALPAWPARSGFALGGEGED